MLTQILFDYNFPFMLVLTRSHYLFKNFYLVYLNRNLL